MANSFLNATVLAARLSFILNQFASKLKVDRYVTLAKDVAYFLNQDFLATRYKYIIAKEIVQAIKDGKMLRLGCLMKGSCNTQFSFTRHQTTASLNPMPQEVTVLKPLMYSLHGMKEDLHVTHERYVKLKNMSL